MDPSFRFAASVVEVGGAGTGEIPLGLTDLARRGAGAGGGSFPAESREWESWPDWIRLSMNEALFASISAESAVSGLGRVKVVSGTVAATELV